MAVFCDTVARLKRCGVTATVERGCHCISPSLLDCHRLHPDRGQKLGCTAFGIPELGYTKSSWELEQEQYFAGTVQVGNNEHVGLVGTYFTMGRMSAATSFPGPAKGPGNKVDVGPNRVVSNQINLFTITIRVAIIRTNQEGEKGKRPCNLFKAEMPRCFSADGPPQFFISFFHLFIFSFSCS